ncbi:MAG: Methionyl-tRNA formyltransferase [Firmicutes bacterium]|nr:Methionyl-tRNA formyltransferase [Bacillota bacterium]MDI6705473.1 methionyl-tRNA formyltransferase [Bacillota bacterium]
MRVVFMGTPEFAAVSLKKLISTGYNVEAVVTQPDRPKGRGKKIQPPPVKQVACSAGIEVLQPERVRDKDFVSELKKISPDVIVVVAFGQILQEEILNIPPLGCINVHASLLPKYRGAAPINWCIINGEVSTGITTMYMDKGMDTGDMIYREEIAIENDESAGHLHDRLAGLGADVLVKTLGDVSAGVAPRTPQDHGQASYAPPLDREDGKVDWQKPAGVICNLIRGTDPWPGSYTHYEGLRIKLWKATAVEGSSGERPGTVLEVSSRGIRVQAGDGQVLIQEIQLPSSRRMTVDEYIRGNTLVPGKALGD